MEFVRTLNALSFWTDCALLPAISSLLALL